MFFLGKSLGSLNLAHKCTISRNESFRGAKKPLQRPNKSKTQTAPKNKNGRHLIFLNVTKETYGILQRGAFRTCFALPNMVFYSNNSRMQNNEVISEKITFEKKIRTYIFPMFAFRSDQILTRFTYYLSVCV